MILNRSIIVTGGTTDLGTAICIKFIKSGWTVFLGDKDIEAATLKANELRSSYHGECIPVLFDPLNAKLDSTVLLDCTKKFGYIPDALVCAHRMLDIPQEVTDVDLCDFETVLRKNVFGYFMPARTIAKEMIANEKPGAIVFVGDACFQGAIPGQSKYTISMGAVNSLAKGLALDFAEYGIRVNCVAPGPIANKSDSVKNSHIPLGTISTAAQIADSVFFFSSEMSGNATGSTLIIDGGLDCIVPGAY